MLSINLKKSPIFYRPGDPPEYGYLYGIPAAALLGGYITTAMQVHNWIYL